MSFGKEHNVWPAVAVVGAGAVGCYFGGMLARAGVPVTLIGRRQHMDAIAREGLFIDGQQVRERVRMAVSTEISSIHASRIVLLCVKTVDTEAVARTLRPHLTDGSLVVSLQNGVDNVERIYAASEIEAIPAVVYVASAMSGPGHVKHSGRGDLIIGRTPGGLQVEEVASMFERAGIPCSISRNIKTDLWTKMIMNCAYNAISALGRSRYGGILRFQETRDVMKRVIEEAVAVARAEGVLLSETDMIEAAFQLGEAMTAATSSMAQDINRAKPTEIDSLNGYVVRRGVKLGVETPVNQTLYALIKLLEQSVKED